MRFEYEKFFKENQCEILEERQKTFLIKHKGFDFVLYKKAIRKNILDISFRSCLQKNDYLKYILNKSDRVDNLDFSISEFKGVREKFKFNCKIHGECICTISQFLDRGVRCNKCKKLEVRDRFSKIHGEKFLTRVKEKFPQFDYSLVKYKNTMSKVKVICPHHGLFEVTPNELLGATFGCHSCSLQVTQFKMDDYIKICPKGSNVYILHLKFEGKEFVKVGISKNVSKRLKQLRNQSVELIYGTSYNFSDAGVAWCVEKDVHNAFKDKKVSFNGKFDGYTECFDINLLKDIDLLVRNLYYIDEERYDLLIDNVEELDDEWCEFSQT